MANSAQFGVQKVEVTTPTGAPIDATNPLIVTPANGSMAITGSVVSTPSGGVMPVSGTVTALTQRPGPSNRVVSGSAHLASGAGTEMAVDGSTAQVVYSAGPIGDVWYITDLRLVIVDHGDFEHDEFGGMDSLDNGVIIRWVIGGTPYDIAVVYDNSDFELIFDTRPYDDDRGIMSMSLKFSVPVKLGDGDLIEVIIRDGLEDVNSLRMVAVYVVEV